MKAKPTILSAFLGLNNVADPETGTTSDGGQITWQWLTRADNVDVFDNGKIGRRDGWSPFSPGGAITASFSTFDFSRMYVIDGGALKQIQQDGSRTVLWEGLSGDAFWTEINGEVFLSCSEKLVIHQDGRVSAWGVPVPFGGMATDADGRLDAGRYQVAFTHVDLADGKEGGAGPAFELEVARGGISVSSIPALPGYATNVYVADRGTVFYLAATLSAGEKAITINRPPAGRELVTQFLDAPPAAGRHVAEFGGRIYLAEYVPEADASVIWFSEPLGFHLFNLNAGFFQVPGEVVQMGSGKAGPLVVCTRNRTHLYDGQDLQTVDYGAIPGQHASRGPDGRLYFWTTRGLCRAAPFENLTESRISVSPGRFAAGGVIQRHGYTRYVVALQSGGTPFNQRT